MLENRSFDHMLGALQAVVPAVDGVPPSGPRRNNVDAAGGRFAQDPTAAPIVDPDPKHETRNVLAQLSGGNAGFVKDYEHSYKNVNLTSKQKHAVMTYYPLEALPVLHALGRAFAVCDHWFSSVPGPTWTNRLFAMSGTSLGRVDMPQGLFQWNLHRYEQPSVFRRVREAGRSYRIYFGDFPLALLLADCRRPSAALKFSDLETFLEDASGSAADFPDFAFVEPRYLRSPNDDHPPHDIAAGEELVAQVYDSLRENDELWRSTLLVVTYDEHGGFYDHVKPPRAVPPDEHHEEYAFDQCGVRVPALFISPWIQPQVVKTPCDHTALLRSLQIRWGLREMGRRVAMAPDILADLVLTDAPREDTPMRLTRPRRARRPARRRPTEKEPLSDHQRAIVAFSTYLEAQTASPAPQKARAVRRTMRSAEDARQIAEERARRYLRQFGGRERETPEPARARRRPKVTSSRKGRRRSSTTGRR
jgi:phospholipase C